MLKHCLVSIIGALGVMAFVTSVSAAQGISDGVVKIGVLDDMSGVYSDFAGPGVVTAANMAIQDFGGEVLGQPIKVISADNQNKADVSSTITREWIDNDQVDMITGIAASSAALAVQGLAANKKTLTFTLTAGSTELTEKACTPYGIHYVYDTHALPVGTAQAVVKNGGKRWFFITADYAFGQSLEKQTSAVVNRLAGEVVGSKRVPLGTNDFASYLLTAQSSGADVIAFANAGQDLVNALKQAHAFDIGDSGDQRLVSLLIFLNNIKSLGLDTAAGVKYNTAFYWDRTPKTRAWSKRFFEKQNAMPSMVQAGAYSAVTTYLNAIKAAGTDDADKVRAQLGKMTINDFFAQNGRIEANGLMRHDMFLMEVKSPSESDGDWDLAKVMQTIPGDEAFIPLAESTCPLLNN